MRKLVNRASSVATIARLALLAIVTLSPPCHGASARLEGLELDRWEEGVRAVMTLSDSTRVRHFYISEGSEKLVLDFYDTVNALRRWNHPELIEGPVTGVRTSQYRPRPDARSRVVFDLSEPCRYNLTTRGSHATVTLMPLRSASSVESPPSLASAAPPAVDPPAPIEDVVAPALSPATPHQARLRGVSGRALVEALAKLGIEAGFDGGEAPIYGDVRADDPTRFREALRDLAEGG
ncbi:MAG: hypothetical protein CME06_01385 [Gemmatimonadetes bacterium]|nr:hypothetical protein [Gemmatimonadota bacterium]